MPLDCPLCRLAQVRGSGCGTGGAASAMTFNIFFALHHIIIQDLGLTGLILSQEQGPYESIASKPGILGSCGLMMRYVCRDRVRKSALGSPTSQ